ncbi:MAG: amino acid ABC transporter permease [Leptolyngbyaceae bacterium]|nr:amino acid ABC transporter permease [Leptolyngbyaceae bacterium]
MEFISVILDAMPSLLLGAVITLQLTAVAIIFGSVGGLGLALVRLYAAKPLRIVASMYVDFFRGTPLLVQIFIVYFGLPALMQGLGIGFTMNRPLAAGLALSMNAAAYLAEIFRGGIQSIELGQVEASQSLGMGSIQAMQYIIFPQALRRIIPPLGNEFITMLKDTSLVAVIGFEELFRRGQLIVANNYRSFEIYFAIGLIYLVLNVVMSRVFAYLEYRMNPLRTGRKPQTSAVV